MKVPKIVVHTDVLLDYLLHTGNACPVLRRAMGTFFCYATVFSAIELFAIARSERQRRCVAEMFSAMKILGLNARSAKTIGSWIATQPALPRMNLLIAAVCLESRLPILVMEENEFRGIGSLDVIVARTMQSDTAAGKLAARLRR